MRYTYVRQHDTTDCAAACLAMVCLHYKKEITITRLRDMMGTDLKGTNLVGLQKAANELGFTTAAVRVDRENFLSDFSLPCIAQVITDQGLAHFVVVFKKTTLRDDGERRKHMLDEAERVKEAEEKGKKHKCKDYVIIGDPATELKKISLDEFYKNFTGVLLLLNPTSEFSVSQRKKLAPGAPGYEAQQASEKDDGKPNRWGMMKRYIDLLLPQKKLFFYAILSSVITTILGIASSMFNKILMDEVLPYGLDNLLVTLIIVFSMVSLTSSLIGFVRQWVLIHLSIKIDIPLMLGYFGHIFHLPMKFFATRKTGDITTRYSDANTIKSIFTSIALSLVMDISMAIITGIILFRMNAMLFSISLFMALVSILLVLVFKQPYKRINEETMIQSAALNSQMIESLRGIETIKCNANEDTQLENLEKEYIKSLKISLRSSRISTGQGLISTFISTGFSMLTTYVGISQVLHGEMTLGGFMAFSTLSSYFTSPLSNLIGLQMSIQEAGISMKRLTEIMDYPAEDENDKGYELTPLKDLSQPGQFACKETCTLIGPSMRPIENVRILGPLRSGSQVEISKTDSFVLKVKPPVRESGNTAGSAPITIVGPKGVLTLKEGCIIANRHIHMSPADAARFGVKDGDTVDVDAASGTRRTRWFDVQIRVSDKFRLEMHVDTDDANAVGLGNGSTVTIVRESR